MDFFSSISVNDDDGEEIEYRPQPWEGPPEDVLGAVVPLNLIVVRTANVVFTLSHATVYPTGCDFALRLLARRGDLSEDDWFDLQECVWPHRRRPGAAAESGPRFGIRLADGTKILTSDRHPFRVEDGTPSGSVLLERGSGGSGGDRTVDQEWNFWLWPLPAPAPLEFAVEWQALDVPLTFTEVDGALLAAAATRAQPLWP